MGSKSGLEEGLQPFDSKVVEAVDLTKEAFIGAARGDIYVLGDLVVAVRTSGVGHTDHLQTAVDRL